jgi:hypothetical protein
MMVDERTESLDTRATPFGEVLAELMLSRGIEPTPEEIIGLAERAGLDGSLVLAYAAGQSTEDIGPFPGIAEELRLSLREKVALAMAYTFGRGA